MTTLEEWLDAFAPVGAGESVSPWITKGDTYRSGYPRSARPRSTHS